MTKKIKDILQYIVIYLMIIGMLLLIGAIFKIKIPTENRDVAIYAIGVFSAKFADSIAYLLNSSKGSAEKSDIIAQLPALPEKPVEPSNP